MGTRCVVTSIAFLLASGCDGHVAPGPDVREIILKMENEQEAAQRPTGRALSKAERRRLEERRRTEELEQRVQPFEGQQERWP